MEALPAESTDSSVGAVAPAEEPKTEVQKPDDQEPKPDNYKCRRCPKAFLSGPAFCGHQNAHRFTKDPNKVISPVLAAVLYHPLPGDENLDLFPNKPADKPGPSKEKAVSKKKQKRKRKQKQPASAAAAANKSPRFHPYPKRGKNKEPIVVQHQPDINDLMLEGTDSSDDAPNDMPPPGEDLLGDHEQLILKDADAAAASAQPKYHYHPFERADEPEPLAPVYQSRPETVTLDLFGEWAPLSGFGGELGTSSYRRDSAGDAALQIGSRRPRSSAPLDLELKLGFGPGY